MILIHFSIKFLKIVSTETKKMINIQLSYDGIVYIIHFNYAFHIL